MTFDSSVYDTGVNLNASGTLALVHGLLSAGKDVAAALPSAKKELKRLRLSRDAATWISGPVEAEIGERQEGRGQRDRPGLQSARASPLRLLRHLSEIIQDYRQVILNELDLTLEADNTRRMRHYFTGSSMMYVPEVYIDSKDVMVAERITAFPFQTLKPLKSWEWIVKIWRKKA